MADLQDGPRDAAVLLGAGAHLRAVLEHPHADGRAQGNPGRPRRQLRRAMLSWESNRSLLWYVKGRIDHITSFAPSSASEWIVEVLPSPGSASDGATLGIEPAFHLRSSVPSPSL